MNKIEPIALKAGDQRVLINGTTIDVDFRVIAEDRYQLMLERIKSLEKSLVDLYWAAKDNPQLLEERLNDAWEIIKQRI